MQASTVREASLLSKCLKFCEELDLNKFDADRLSRILDLRPALASNECMLLHVQEPGAFVVVKKDVSYMSPLLGIGDKLIWAFNSEAPNYVPEEILETSEISILPTKKGH